MYKSDLETDFQICYRNETHMDEYSVKLDNIVKMYKMYNSKKDRLKDLFFHRNGSEEFYALRGVSLRAMKGDSVGLIGVNGSGKSTLAKIIGGITVPTSGDVVVHGEAAMVAVSAGLNNQLTGIENIEMKGLLIGLSMKEINMIKDKIIEFADIGEFITQPVKTYSSGMKSRLGFAISVCIDPDILIIDEALSVGDQTFTQKCFDKMNEFRNKDKTIIFVSHSLNDVERFCNKVCWLEYGVIRAFGTTEEVLPRYRSFLNSYSQMSDEEKNEFHKGRMKSYRRG